MEAHQIACRFVNASKRLNPQQVFLLRTDARLLPLRSVRPERSATGGARPSNGNSISLLPGCARGNPTDDSEP